MTIKNKEFGVQLCLKKIHRKKLIDIYLRKDKKTLCVFQTSNPALYNFLKGRQYMYVGLRAANQKRIEKAKQRPEIKAKLQYRAMRQAYAQKE